jgi:hypothetical protein
MWEGRRRREREKEDRQRERERERENTKCEHGEERRKKRVEIKESIRRM